MGFSIKGTGYAIPSRRVTNEALSEIVDTSDEWIVTRTGIQSRYLSETETTSDLAARAALQAIQDAKIKPEDIQLIICATATGDHVMPAAANLVQKKLGLNHPQLMAFDVNAACTGFVYGLQIAASMIERFPTILVIGSETISRIIDWQDRNTCVLFGDGAGAFVLQQDSTKTLESHYAHSMPDVHDVLIAPGIGLVNNFQVADRRLGYLQMQGKEVFRFATQAMHEAIIQVCAQAQLDLSEIDWIVPHQANIRILNYVSKKLDIDIDRFIINLDQFGNSSAASVAMAFAQADHAKQFKSGQKIVLVGFGAGLSVGATLIER